MVVAKAEAAESAGRGARSRRPTARACAFKGVPGPCATSRCAIARVKVLRAKKGYPNAIKMARRLVKSRG
jgi:hypothetical protein